MRISQGAAPPAPLRSKRCWAWVQWTANVRVAAESVGADGVAHIVCKAVDDQYNVQVLYACVFVFVPTCVLCLRILSVMSSLVVFKLMFFVTCSLAIFIVVPSEIPGLISFAHTQPDTIVGIWNIRGILNNSWHRIEVNLKD